MKKTFLILMLMFAAGVAQGQAHVEKQLEYFKAQIDSAQQERNALKIAAAYANIVALCRSHSSFDDIFSENLYNYGLWSTYAGQHQTAIDIFIELLEMPDNLGDTSLFTLKAQANNGLGMIFFFLERWDDALVHYLKARDMATELQNEFGVSITENNIGNIYQKKGNYQTAIAHYRRCLQLQEKIDDKGTICNAYYNLGDCYIELDNFDESIPYLNLALNIAREIDDKEIASLALLKLARYHTQAKVSFSEAAKQIEQAGRIAEEAGYRQVLKEVYETRSIIEEERGNFAAALTYFKQYKALGDSLFNENSVNQLHEYEVRYQTKEKEFEIARQQAEISRHRSLQYLYIGGLSAAGLLLVMLIYIVTLRTRRNRELSEMNAIKDKFFSIISHDLKNPAVAQRDALQILTDNTDKWEVSALLNYHRKLLKSANGLVELLKNLLNWAQIQTGRESYHPLPFDIVAALQPDLGVIKDLAERKNITLETIAPPTAIVTGDENMLLTVVRNLLANAVKFTATDGKIVLNISTGRGVSQYALTTVSITDTGTGMTPEQLQNLFRIDRQHSRKGTAGEQGSGLGLIVCRELLQKHGSTLHVESEEGKGSRFWFEV
ncbi:MAG: tetratricopeptide repeat-containing sensor histidine kinase [Bacteroidales bacterium]|nr:tetratricopeptide repeat-containing sensor histidine kinase [Bacteroidales bacterium]